MKKFLIIFVLLLSVYSIAYLIVRKTNAEVWEKTGETFVIYPQDKIAYYLFRPYSYIDEKITGIGSHIGPHR